MKREYSEEEKVIKIKEEQLMRSRWIGGRKTSGVK